MLESALYPDTANQAHRTYSPKVNERTAGSMPVWGSHKNANNQPNFTSALNQTNAPEKTIKEDSFTLADIVDIINPLHHIPIIGSAYRHITGDTIKPIGRLIGSTAFGGPIGAITNLADIVIESETGHSMASHALRVTGFKSNKTTAPEQTLTQIIQQKSDPDLSRALLSFSDLSYQNNAVTQAQELASLKPTPIKPAYND